MDSLKTGLQQLGVHGKVRATRQGGLVSVYLNGLYFGLWDTERKTFVD